MDFLRAIQLLIIFIVVAALCVGLQLSLRVLSEPPDAPAQTDPIQPTDPEPATEATQQVFEPEPHPQPKPHRVALTFDDGPYDKVTPALLDGLEERGVKVTFFILGSRIKGREQILARAAGQGHQIANHSYSHSNFTKLSAAEIAREIADTANAAELACGSRPWMVRPPYGAVNKTVKEAVSEPFIMWSVDPEDWRYRDAQKVYDSVMETVRDGDIILLHDAYPTSVEAALRIIDSLGEQGYDFVTVEELYAECGTDMEAGKSYFSAPPRTKTEPDEPDEPATADEPSGGEADSRPGTQAGGGEGGEAETGMGEGGEPFTTAQESSVAAAQPVLREEQAKSDPQEQNGSAALMPAA